MARARETTTQQLPARRRWVDGYHGVAHVAAAQFGYVMLCLCGVEGKFMPSRGVPPRQCRGCLRKQFPACAGATTDADGGPHP